MNALPKEYCFDLMDGICFRSEEKCWFRHDLPKRGSEEYQKALRRRLAYLQKKKNRKSIKS